MAIAFIKQATGGANGLTASATIAATTNGNTLIASIAVAAGATSNVLSVSDTAGNSWVLGSAGFVSGSNTRAEIWYALNAASTTSVTVTLSGSTLKDIAINVSEFSGIAATAALDVSANQANPTSSTILTGTINTLNANDLIVAVCSYNSSTVTTTLDTAGFTALTDTVQASQRGRQAYRIVSSTGAYQVQWTRSASGNTGAAILALKDAAAPIHTVKQGNWRWYSDAAADGSMTPLAAENSPPTLSGAQMQNAIVRLRVQLNEKTGAAGNGSIDVQYGEDGTNWATIPSQVVETNQQGKWLRWTNGGATSGSTISSQFLTGTTVKGAYHEDKNATEPVGASVKREIDIAVKIHWPPPSTTIKIRLLYAGDPLLLDTGATEINLTTSTVANRPYAVAKSSDNGSTFGSRELRYGPWDRVFYDGSHWWMFYVDFAASSTMSYYYSTDGVTWGAAQTTGMTGSGRSGRNSIVYQAINGVKTVFIFWNASSGNMRYKRGTINGTTITWGSENNFGVASLGRNAHTAIDAGGYRWTGGTNGTGSIWAARSTAADTGTSWSAGFNAIKTVADPGVVDGDIFAMIGLSSDKALCVWHSGTTLKYAVVSDSTGFGSIANVHASPTAHAQDWGVTRMGGYVWLSHKASTDKLSAWSLRRYTEAMDLWESVTASGISGQTSDDDGLPITAHGHDLYIFGTFAGATEGQGDRIVNYAVYHGPRLNGTWSPLATLAPEGRGNGDQITAPRVSGNNQIVVGFEFNDDETIGTGFTIEAHKLDVTEVRLPRSRVIQVGD